MRNYFATVLMTLLVGTAHSSNSPNIEWPAYGGSAGGGHYSAASEITPGNVARLEQAWTHQSGDFRLGELSLTEESRSDDTASMPSAFAATPIMVRDTLYYCTPFNRVFALDPASGKKRWSFDPKVDMSREHITNCRGVSSWTSSDEADAFCGHRILLGTLDARLIALDGKTGKRCTDFGNNGEVHLAEAQNDHEPQEYAITSAPAIAGDLVISGAFVLDSQRNDVPSGVVRAYNIRTGAFVWGWNPTHPDRPQKNERGEYVGGTTNVWSTISIDAERGLVIVPTGNSSPDYYGGDRDGHQDYYSSSVVALSVATGEVVWNFQTVHHDIWDMDVPAQPTFADLTIDGKTSAAVVQATKMGLTFVLDRATGKPLHPVEERPVSQEFAVPGEYLSPTQPFPVKPEPLHQLGMTPNDAWGLTFWDKGACREKLENMHSGDIYIPPSLEGSVMYPSQLGGNNWGSPALDPQRKLMVVTTQHLAFSLRLVPQAECPTNLPFPQVDSPYCVILVPITSPLGIPCSAPPWATIAAVDLESGDIKWQIPFGTMEEMAPWPFYHFIEGGLHSGGPMVTAGGLIFVGAASDGYFRAFNTETGEELWQYKLPATANSVPMSYRYGGEQYVVVAAGGHFTSPMPSGDYLMAFKLKK